MAFLKVSMRLKAQLLNAAMLIFVFSASITTGFAQKQLTDEEFTWQKSKIERAHQGFYKLSFDADFVRDNIMPAIRTERKTIAPNFPERKVGQNTDIAFRNWMENYPTEYELYMIFLRKQHEKWRTASTSSANH